MKKSHFLMVLFLTVFSLLISLNAFANNAEVARLIKNWKPFYNKDDMTLSYEYKEIDNTQSPRIYIFNDEIGYIYFYLRLDSSEEARSKISEDKTNSEIQRDDYGYSVSFVRLDCNEKNYEELEEYHYSDQNELIQFYAIKNDPKKISESKFMDKLLEIMSDSSKLVIQSQADLKKNKVEAIVTIDKIEVNPYEFKGKVIAVPMQFQKMLSETSGVFYSGYTNLSDTTGVSDQIIVSGIPAGTHFDSGIYANRLLLIVTGEGTTTGTNIFGAKITVPLLQFVSIVSDKLQSVGDQIRQNSAEDALRNSKAARNQSK